MSKIFLIDVARCTGCYNCQLACKDEHCENDWTPYAAPQPLTGHFWCHVSEHVQGTIPKVKIHYISKMCAHCPDAACMDVCPQQAITRRPDGFVLIDPAKCSGCKACMEACPYEVIYFNDDRNIAQKCTGCTHLLDHGARQPRCSEACPTDAIVFGEEEELREKLEGATPLAPGGKVWYKNIPGEFVGGTIYDPVEKEVIIGGTCTLAGEGKAYETVTDAYGDFWFRDLPRGGRYELTIQAKGFQTKVIPDICTEKSVNLDDIPLERE
ncbi:MAG: 4Fe-4S dicluster domain-containing protein [Oscillospiraceae bacterium]